ncbi:FemAB family protein [Flavobacterium terrae]|uniref:Acetyltransferase (GNAT) domain-containing protein n=1 Tax=Flavobacterium terrae TaxID=415425 RepID=A0A1M6CNC7_9FLAO|nr:FemAB family protein [Flavobacterium terrae]SHI62506.1 hypothetical protein SAMN05444363_1012 [Flavobacterium terrae]
MSQFTIKKYESKFYDLWNQFVADSKNGTFLFHRDFMEYHSDRFEDCSLLVFDEKDKLVGILPANRVGNELYSHQGLTYGGLILGKKSGGEYVEQIYNSLLNFFKKEGLETFFLKLPSLFYSQTGFSGLDYFLFKSKAQLCKRDMNLVLDFSKKLNISKSKLKQFNKVSKLSLEIINEDDFTSFWQNVLVPKLKQKFNAKPVHSVDEIMYLKNKFPNNIEQYSVYDNHEIIAGITIFKSQDGIKSQYGAATKKGESLRALDYLFISLIEKFQNEGKSFFDMGIVNDLDEYNKGMLKQKEELGCRIYSQDSYKLSL